MTKHDYIHLFKSAIDYLDKASAITKTCDPVYPEQKSLTLGHIATAKGIIVTLADDIGITLNN